MEGQINFAVREKYPVPIDDKQNGVLYADVDTFVTELTAALKGGGKALALEKMLSGRGFKSSTLGPDLVAHSIQQTGLSIKDVLRDGNELCTDAVQRIVVSLNAAWELLCGLDAPGSAKGYVYIGDGGQVCDFSPVHWAQHDGGDLAEYPTLDEAVDDYFSKLEINRGAHDEESARKKVLKKVDAVRKDHMRRVAALEKKTLERARAAELVAMNAWVVDRAISIIRQAVDSGMDWEALGRLLQRERDMGDDVAQLVVGLKLDDNKITLRLHEEIGEVASASDDCSESDDAEESRHTKLRPLNVDVDISLSAHANARKLFNDKKAAMEKASRTREASEKVVKELAEKAEQTVERNLRRKIATKGIRESRKAMWFEKFDWFVTSEGLLVISGRDAQQNELLVKRYLRASHGDVYVHADIHGAATCILRNPFGKGRALPAESLRQAGAMAVARSAAWGAKVIAGAWWVHAAQVSKTAPSGEYLSTGSFMVRGKRITCLQQSWSLDLVSFSKWTRRRWKMERVRWQL